MAHQRHFIMKYSLRLLLGALTLAALAGCKPHDDHSRKGEGHAHQAPHGGTLLELGDHAGNLELLRDTKNGTLSVYLLDGHAENFVRIAVGTLEAVAFTGGQKRTLTLKAVANPATGETVGNTSLFVGQADWLKSGGELNGEIGALEIRGTKFGPVAFQLK